MTVQADRRRSIAVPKQLRDRLPGLEAALDVDTAAAVIERELLGGRAETRIVSLSVGSIWVGDDTCALRYRVRVKSPSSNGDGEQVVLGEVFSTADQARAAVGCGAASLSSPPSVPWRARAAADASIGLVLRLFPHDPALPTLPQALDRATVCRTLAGMRPEPVEGRLDELSAHVGNAQVTVVHHPRQGACVLRYDVDGTRLFGKVYGDDTTGSSVAAVQSRLRNLSGSVRFPTVLGYHPSLRLLVMDAVPGVQLTQPAGVAAAGHALGHLHAQDIAGARTCTRADDLADLDRALRMIGKFRIDTADVLRQRISAAVPDAYDAPVGVLTHGDFTPSQLLWDGAAVGVVDLDEICVADPARDLGRFIAAFALRASRQIGLSYASDQVPELTASLVQAYLEARPLGRRDYTLLQRVAVYRTLSLARSAARSCRQLKEDRLTTALLLMCPELVEGHHAFRGTTSADPTG
jgi:aminoglycoside phosphotransferase